MSVVIVPLATEVEVVQSSNPARAICQAAGRFGAEVICMGTHGRSGISGTVLGSVAREVMAKSRRPLLTMRETEV